MFRALADGSVDVVIASLHNGNHWVRELGLANVTIAGELILPDFSGEDLRFGMRPGLAPLVGIFDSALAAITPTERRSIENRWLGASYRDNSGAPQALSEGEKSWLRQHGPLKVCTDPDWMPIEALDGGRHAGIAADYLERMSQQFDLAYEIVPTNTWLASLQAVQARRCDLLTMAVQTPQQSIHLNFTAPYYTTPNVLLARIETPFVEGLDAFAGRQVGIVRGHAIADQLRSRYPQLELVEVDNEKEGLRELQRGRLEGYIGTLSTVNYHLRELGFADIKVVSRIPVDSKLSLATRNDLPELFSIAEKMVASLSDADRQRIESRWQTIRIEPGIDTALLWRWGSIIFVALALLILWNRKLGSLNRQLAEANQKLAQLNITDPLTGIGNRQFFEQEFAREFSRCQRNAQTFTTAMIDIDHFKKINDSLGHAAGDHCLVELARCLQQHLRRQTDNIARIGGEEFVAFMSGDTREEVLAHFEALRSDISALQITWEGQLITFTISIGLVHGIPEQPDNPAAWLRQADQALYRAKAAGRNRLDAEPPANA
ncbi:diguanylate cyclase [Azonexus hydrophilus]|uniref:diguanylate cyclase n=1 Tax=Azonexus hydrophilus TaxID=418702 RepID=UPI002491C6E0|nr:diguanylate cyclase [Azonexus hydrophilus]